MTALWIVTLVLVYSAIAVAVAASRTGRQLITIAIVVPVALAFALAVLGGPAPSHPLFTAFGGFGFLALATVGGSPLVSLVLRFATRTVRLGTHGGMLVSDVDSPAPDREILRGGSTIGYLERFASVGAIMLGQPGAVAVVVAVKGLGRYSELENASARERFIIGTLTSLSWAGCCTAAFVLSR